MDESNGRDGAARSGPEQPTVSADLGAGDVGGASASGERGESLAPSEAFQTLASEVRVAVLVALLAAERAGDEPLSFSRLQSAAGSDSSAGFAYHLRQLSGHFVRQCDSGYVLTPAGRRAAETVVAGTFTGGADRDRAS